MFLGAGTSGAAGARRLSQKQFFAGGRTVFSAVESSLPGEKQQKEEDWEEKVPRLDLNLAAAVQQGGRSSAKRMNTAGTDENETGEEDAVMTLSKTLEGDDASIKAQDPSQPLLDDDDIHEVHPEDQHADAHEYQEDQDQVEHYHLDEP
ncbi:unnamed protein product, partial [Amoebophrya sp. A25]